MKYLFLLITGLYLSSCSIQYIPNEIENGKILGVMPVKYERAYYQITKSIQSNREDIFRQSRRWTAFHQYDPTSSFAVSDNQIGDVIASGRIDARTVRTKSGPVILPRADYSISVESNEGSYRATITNVRLTFAPTISHGVELRVKSMSKKRVRDILVEMDGRIKDMLADLETFVPSEVKSTP